MSVNYKAGKCLEPGCEEPIAKGELFCAGHLNESEDTAKNVTTLPKTVADLAIGETGFVSALMSFYMVSGQTYIGGNFPVEPKQSLISTIQIKRISDEFIAISAQSFGILTIWTADVLIDVFIKVTVENTL